MAKEATNRVRYYLGYAITHLQILFIKMHDVLLVLFSILARIRHHLECWLKTSRNHYTVLIVPQKKSTVRKISASSTHVRWAVLVVALISISGLYFFYHFLSIKRDASELEQLRRLSVSQKEQIHQLASKIGDFEKKMEILREYDIKIRAMANMVRKPGGQWRGMGGPSPDARSYRPAAPSEAASIHNISKDMDQLIREAARQENSFKEILGFLEKRKSILSRTPCIWPVQGWVTSWFGYRSSPFTGRKEFHSAVDIAARSGKEVAASADGIVADVDRRSDLGNAVAIDHGNGITTSYGHLLKTDVYKGKTVKRGEIIGYVGNTGRSTGSHLHYSVYLNGVPVNPRKYMP